MSPAERGLLIAMAKVLTRNCHADEREALLQKLQVLEEEDAKLRRIAAIARGDVA